MIISDRYHHLLVIISYEAAIQLVDLTQVVQWRNVTYRYVLQFHNVTVSQIAVSKSQNILNEGRCSIVTGVERKGSPSQNF